MQTSQGTQGKLQLHTQLASILALRVCLKNMGCQNEAKAEVRELCRDRRDKLEAEMERTALGFHRKDKPLPSGNAPHRIAPASAGASPSSDDPRRRSVGQERMEVQYVETIHDPTPLSLVVLQKP